MKLIGQAKKRFFELHQRTPWFPLSHPTSSQSWPFFAQLRATGFISALYEKLVHHLLENHPAQTEETALFICHLIQAAKEGHLCVKIEGSELEPPIHQIWRAEKENALSIEDGEQLHRVVIKGSQQLPNELLADCLNLNDDYPSTPFCKFQTSFYLQRYWVYESLIFTQLKRHLRTKPAPNLDTEQLEMLLKHRQEAGSLLPEQAKAIYEALTHPISCITGGPGTGKTYTAGLLIRLYWELLTPEERSRTQIALTAPTGKAAVNLQQSLSQAVGKIDTFPTLQAKTLHALLGLKQRGRARKKGRLAADLIIVDESSMIDAKLMAYLLEAVKSGARLVLLGDPHQLPSVEAGNLFADIVKLSRLSQALPVTHLRVCLRAELKSLVDFAQLVKEGEPAPVLSSMQSGSLGIKKFHLPEDVKEGQTVLTTYAAPFFPSHLKSSDEGEAFFDIYNQCRLLSPLRKGPFGTEAINQLIWQKICQSAPSDGWLALPIMITSNDYRQDLFNGETGLLLRKLPLENNRIGDYALFPHREIKGTCRRVPALLLPPYEMAFCLSVYKSQGSEFDRIILLLPEGSERFGRNLLYTAITRAKKQIDLFGSNETLSATISHSAARLSGIEQLAINNPLC